MQRRNLLAAALGGSTAMLSDIRGVPQTVPDGASLASPFSAATVPDLARTLAQQPHRPRGTPLPREFQRLDYDAYRRIDYDRRHALWANSNLPFQIMPHHRGFLFPDRVELFEVAEGQAAPLRYRPEHFNFGGLPVPERPEDIGFAGFRILFPLNRADHFDELCSFLGASYFRGLGRGHSYGLSARGLAIRTADPGGEEFPAFTAFWIERPAAGATAMRVHALLESPSVTGAFSFVITPGENTTMEVDATLFPRVDLPRIGIAPASSMFFFGPADREGVSDFRPSVHDSDGLMMITGRGEQLWRVLANPRDLQVSGFQDHSPRGFGLVQRSRAFTDFQDLGARYERRPSLWVEPLEEFGPGEVHLVEIPTQSEIHDNIAAAWTPRQGLQAGSPRRIRYRLHWLSEPPGPPGLARFAMTRVTNGVRGARRRLFVLDTTRLPLGLNAQPRISTSAGEVQALWMQENIETGGLRLNFELDPGRASVAELRLRLMVGTTPIAEDWMFRWTG